MPFISTLFVFILSLAAFGAAAPKPVAPNDGVIEANIRAKFAKSKISEEHFKVTVKSGVALLEGKTAIPQRKGVATRLAKTGGARQVVNKIEVSEAARKQLTDRLQKARDMKAASAPATKSESKPAPKSSVPSVEQKSDVKPVPQATAAATHSPMPPTSAEPLRRMQIKR